MNYLPNNSFSANDPLLGYIYQIRYGLYMMLHYRNNPKYTISIETLDDIVLETNSFKQLVQTKHHLQKQDLSDRNKDFWKSIRIWSENIKNKTIDIDNTFFYLITTSDINNDSFLSLFSANEPSNIETIKKKMLEISSETGNSENEKGYNSFRSLEDNDKLHLIQNIRILKNIPNIIDTLTEIHNELRFSAPAGKIEPFAERLEGWWNQHCVQVLNHKIPYISSEEVSKAITDIRDLFTQDNLPDDFPNPLPLSENDLSEFEERVFVRQLKLIAIGKNSVAQAINDFRRAYEQRSKWLRETLTDIEEYESYDKKLVDYWNRIFCIIKDECEDKEAEQLIQIGRSFYAKHFIESEPPVKLRDKFQAKYMTIGSCHMLADKKDIGWHPKYEELLSNY